jgi:hypothetical protein
VFDDRRADMDMREKFAANHESYLTALEAAIGDPQLKGRAASAYAEYLEALKAAWREPEGKEAAAAYERWASILRDSLVTPEARRAAGEAFRSYLQAAKETWARLDIAAIDASALSAVVESMSTVAWLALQTTQALQAPPVAGGTTEWLMA